MNSICFTFYFLQFILCTEYSSNLILFVCLVLLYFFFFLKSISSLLLYVKVWYPLSGAEEWAEENLCILVGIIYYVKNKLILHLKFSGTVFYPGKYIFLFWCHNESKEISIQNIFIAPWKNLITEWDTLHNIKLCSLTSRLNFKLCTK